MCWSVGPVSRMTAAAPFSLFLAVPPEVLGLKEQRGELGQTECETPVRYKSVAEYSTARSC